MSPRSVDEPPRGFLSSRKRLWPSRNEQDRVEGKTNVDEIDGVRRRGYPRTHRTTQQDHLVDGGTCHARAHCDLATVAVGKDRSNAVRRAICNPVTQIGCRDGPVTLA